MTAFDSLDHHRRADLQLLPITPSACHDHAPQRVDPGCGAAGTIHFAVSGVRKVWRQLGREDTSSVARR